MSLLGKRVPLGGQPFAHRVFESHTERNPERIALTYKDQAYSYQKLNLLANEFAHYLMDRGVGIGSVVGVCLDRSPEMIASILGILKTGAAYAPLDTTYPGQRLRFMVSQITDMKLIVASPSTLSMVEGGAEVLDHEEIWPRLESYSHANPAVRISGNNICYVVFTSGSTGTPKAVAVRHEGWYNLLSWLLLEFGLGASSSGVLVSPFGFDITQRALMAPLFAGSALHLLPSRHFDVMIACKLIRNHRVRTLHCAPSVLYLLLEHGGTQDPDVLSSLDFVFPGGESISIGRLAGWAKRQGNPTRLVNVYGVAECTDVATSHVLTDYDGYARGGVPIGRPIYNVGIHILDSDLIPVAQGEVGEICISGVGVGAGYLNDARMNEERFVSPRPEDGAARFYRTGDLGRVNSGGELMYAGRADRQVKIRGMRVDLGDVEAALAGNGHIRQAVVLPFRGDGMQDTGLIAFVIPSNETSDDAIDVQDVRRKLLEAVPVHMVPARIIPVEQFPLSPNGKVDRDALATCLPRLGEAQNNAGGAPGVPDVCAQS